MILIYGALAILVFGALGAYVAAMKHRSRLEGLILGGLFGPLGVLILVLFPDGRRAHTRPSLLRDDRPPAEIPWLREMEAGSGRDDEVNRFLARLRPPQPKP